MTRETACALLIALALAGGCADRNQAAGDDYANPGVGTVDTSRGSGEQQFISDMLEDGRAEIELGRMAQARSQNPAVREFGEMMVRDHTKAGEELKATARQADPRPEETNSDHRELMQKLSGLSGAEFDREYMNAMVAEHEEAVRELEGKSESSTNANVKQWASKTLPAVRQHLERARQISESLR
jgi:putative membrane protein